MARSFEIPDSSLITSPAGILKAPQGLDKTLLVTRGTSVGYLDIDGDIPQFENESGFPVPGVSLVDPSLLRSGTIVDFTCFSNTCNSTYSPAPDQTIFTDPLDPQTYATLWQKVTNSDGVVSEDGFTYVNVQPTPKMKSWEVTQTPETISNYVLATNSALGNKDSYSFYLPQGADKLIIEPPLSEASHCGRPVLNQPKACNVTTGITNNCMVCGQNDTDPSDSYCAMIVSYLDLNVPTPEGTLTEVQLFNTIDRTQQVRMICKSQLPNFTAANTSRYEYCVELKDPVAINQIEINDSGQTKGLFGAAPASGATIVDLASIKGRGDIMHPDNEAINGYCDYNEEAPGGWSTDQLSFCMKTAPYFDSSNQSSKGYSCEVKCKNGLCPISYELKNTDNQYTGKFRHKVGIEGVTAPSFGEASIIVEGGILSKPFVIFIVEDESPAAPIQFKNDILGWIGGDAGKWVTKMELTHKDLANNAFLELPLVGGTPLLRMEEPANNGVEYIYDMTIEATDVAGAPAPPATAGEGGTVYLRPQGISEVKVITLYLNGEYKNGASDTNRISLAQREAKVVIFPKVTANNPYVTNTIEKISTGQTTNIQHVRGPQGVAAYSHLGLEWPRKELLFSRRNFTLPAGYASVNWEV